MLKNLNDGNFNAAANEMDINTSGGVYLQGLQDRRLREQNMFKNGEYEKCTE